jgi:anion-transporting  ArsA/GET3 family ATPase
MTAMASTLSAPPAGGVVEPLLDRALVCVTGKGGCGKTTVAAALGMAAAASDRRALVCEFTEQRVLPRAFGIPPDRRGEIPLRPHLAFLSIDPHEALVEWLRGQPGGAVAATVRGRSGAFDHFVSAAPGAKELVSLGKAVDLTRTARGRPGGPCRYDVVIVDGPSTGHALGMLAAPRTMGEIAPLGPIGRQARELRDFLADDEATGYVAVALPEELPVREAVELEQKLPEAAGHPLDLIMVNGVYPERFSDDEAEQLETLASRPGAAWALRAALSYHHRARRHSEQIAWLRERVQAPVLTLPYLFGPVLGPSDYESLALELTAALITAVPQSASASGRSRTASRVAA